MVPRAARPAGGSRCLGPRRRPGAPDSPGTASALAGDYVDKNGGGARTITFASKNLANDTVTVRVERPTPGFFAKVFGVNSVQVGAKATARTGTLNQARFAAPIGVDKRHPIQWQRLSVLRPGHRPRA